MLAVGPMCQIHFSSHNDSSNDIKSRSALIFLLYAKELTAITNNNNKSFQMSLLTFFILFLLVPIPKGLGTQEWTK